MGRRWLAVCITALVLVALPVSAGAATTIGDVDGDILPSSGPEVAMQATSPADASYVVPSGDWVLTSWSAWLVAGPTYELKIFAPRHAQTGPKSAVVASLAGTPPPGGAGEGVYTFPARLPVNASDWLGIWAPSNGAFSTTSDTGGVVKFTTGSGTTDPTGPFTPAQSTSDTRIMISAKLEPDADRDGFGDETQDQCPGQAGPDNGCPAGSGGSGGTTNPGGSTSPGGTTNPGGTTGGGGTPVSGGSGGSTAAPIVSRITLDAHTFRVNPRGQALARPPRGTTMRFSASQAGRASIVVSSLVPGRRSGRRCVAPSRRLRRARPCRRAIPLTGLLRPAAQGPNALALSGRVHVGTIVRALPPGLYRLTLSVRNAAGRRSNTVAATFTVVR